MVFRKEESGAGGNEFQRKRGYSRRRAVSGFSFFMLAALLLTGQQNPMPNPDRSIILPIANRVPDANDRMQMNDQKAKDKNYEAANIERRKQIADDSAKLLKLANDLKAEVDKTTKDTLSLTVIHKADEIEKLARSVKEKMKLTVGAN